MQVSWLGRLRTFRLPSLSTSDLNERHSFLTVAGPHRTLTCFPINRRAAGHESDIQFYTGSITQLQAECNPQFVYFLHFSRRKPEHYHQEVSNTMESKLAELKPEDLAAISKTEDKLNENRKDKLALIAYCTK